MIVMFFTLRKVLTTTVVKLVSGGLRNRVCVRTSTVVVNYHRVIIIYFRFNKGTHY